MSHQYFFSIQRYFAVVLKEIKHMSRDKFTIAMIVGIPLLQVILFGYAINLNPKNLPTTVISQDSSNLVKKFVVGLKNTKYFSFESEKLTIKQANDLMMRGKLQFIIQIPSNFTQKLIRHKKPNILLITDATDSSASSAGVSAINALAERIFKRTYMHDGLHYLSNKTNPFSVIVHNRYNPESLTQYFIVPGLAGVILTMILVMVTGLAITREKENGTMESLLATPVKPIEVILGKITPYIFVGYAQLSLILLSGVLLFHIRILGDILTLYVLTLPLIVANLLVGITFSTIAKSQLQAVQMTFFFFLPSILLSGFVFPFYGMPQWAQWIGNLLPITHYIRIIRGVVLKDAGFIVLWPSTWPILLFIVLIGTICVKRYKQTL